MRGDFFSLVAQTRARVRRMKRATKLSVLFALPLLSLWLVACEKDATQPAPPPPSPAPSATSTTQKPSTAGSDTDGGRPDPRDAGYYPGSRDKPM
jgi:hypothetical protein